MGIRLVRRHSRECDRIHARVLNRGASHWYTRGEVVRRDAAGRATDDSAGRPTWLRLTCAYLTECPAEALLRLDTLESFCETLLGRLTAARAGVVEGPGGEAISGLRPCPYCGLLAHTRLAEVSQGEFVILHNCGNGLCISTEGRPTREQAIAAWNARASDDAPLAEMESDLFHLARLATVGRGEDVRMWVKRLARRYRASHPALSETLYRLIRDGAAPGGILRDL